MTTATVDTAAVETTAEAPAPVELLNIDPNTLTLETNVRTLTDAEQAAIDDLADSIAAVGVYTPLRGVRDAAGNVMVRDGQRRLLAAQQAGVSTVPVVIHADDADGDAREAHRISEQVLANTARALTGEDTAAAIDQLSMFGVPAAQIASRTGLDRDTVAATVATAEHATARKAVQDHGLTLDQATALVDFEDDDNAVERLTAAARSGMFDHTVAMLRQQRADEEAREEAAQPYRDQGINVLRYYQRWCPNETPEGKKLHELTDLVTATGQPATTENVTDTHLWVHLTEEEVYTLTATGEPVDATEVDWEWTPDEVDEDGNPVELAEGTHDPATITTTTVWVVDHALTDNPKADGLVKRPDNMAATDDDADVAETAAALADAQEAKRHERRRLLALNKAADTATEVRREYVSTLLTRKTPPKGAARFTATTTATGVQGQTPHSATATACDLLGIAAGIHGSGQLAEKISSATDNRAQVIALAMACAAFEDAHQRSSWRDHPAAFAPYMQFLTSTGYTLSPVEQALAGEVTADDAFDQITADAEDAKDDQTDDNSDEHD
jgi:ParB family chromosome partitioning protein